MRKLLSVIHFIWASAVFLASMILVLPFIIVCTLIFDHKNAQDAAFIFVRLWAWIFSTLSLFSVHSRNRQLADNARAYIYVSNHSSFLDAVMLVRTLPQSFKPLGKAELATAPIFGMIYKKIVVMIDRSCKESREKCVSDLKEELSRGQSILIFPEGTMNRTSGPLADFFDGAFRIAIETQTPLAPVVLINAGKLLPRKDPYVSMKPGRITVVFAEPVEVKGMTLEDVPRLKSMVHQQMEQLILANSQVTETGFAN